MKTPPLLLGVVLLFWGWQTDLLAFAAVMAGILESSRLLKSRWNFSDEEFRRIWIFCNLLLIALLFYAFNLNDGPASINQILQDGMGRSDRGLSTAGARTIIAVIRWSPIIFFPLILTQAVSLRSEISLATISIFLWRRRKRALKAGAPMPEETKFNFAYPFFCLCLLASSLHGPDEQQGFFWGFCLLIAWALWPHRSRRLHPVAWAGVLAAAIALGDLGQSSLGFLQRTLATSGAQWLAEFLQHRINPNEETTSIGQIGRFSRSQKIVIRMETPAGSSAPTYLREASYRRYRATTWFGKEEFENVSFETNGTSWVLLTNKVGNSHVTIACYLPHQIGLLPLPTGCDRLDNLDVYPLSKNSLGAVMAEGRGLVIFNAEYAGGATIDAPANTNTDLEVPDREAAVLNRIVEDLKVSGLSPHQKLGRLRHYFRDHFQYTLWQQPPPSRSTNETALGQFLLQTHRGHCEYFASATVLLLRTMHIPARYAVGYAVPESKNNTYLIRQRDGHAWALVWDNDSKTWVDFDTTPSAASVDEDGATFFQFFPDAWSRLWFEFSKFRWGKGALRQYILWGLVPVLAFLFYQIIFKKSWRRHARRAVMEREMIWPGLDSEFYQLERRLAEFIGPRGRNETYSEWLKRAAQQPALAKMTRAIRELLKTHYRYRFDPQGLDEADRLVFKRSVAACLESLNATPSSHH